MKKIVIFMRDDEKGRQLAQCLGTVFPECEIHVLPHLRTGKRQEKGKEATENSKNTGRR